MSLLQVTRWNYKRNGCEMHQHLEHSMLLEEETEFKEQGLIPYLKGGLFQLDAVVEMIDAYCDYNFVYSGTIAKAIGTEVNLSDFDVEAKMTMMNTYIIEALLEHNVTIMDVNSGKSVIDEAMGFVIEANEAKPVKRTTGKVTKGKTWVDPKERISDLLKTRGWDDVQKTASERAEELKEDLSKPVNGTLEGFSELTEEQKNA